MKNRSIRLAIMAVCFPVGMFCCQLKLSSTLTTLLLEMIGAALLITAIMNFLKTMKNILDDTE